MEIDQSLPFYVFTKEHESIELAIYSSAGVSLPEELEEVIVPGQERPSVCWVKALWDTGANNTAVSDRLAATLGLAYENIVEVTTSTGTVRVPIYPIRLVLPNGPFSQELDACEFTYSENDDCDLIIGMDIMTQGDLAMTNFEGRTVFSFRIPSIHVVDFEAEYARM